MYSMFYKSRLKKQIKDKLTLLVEMLKSNTVSRGIKSFKNLAMKSQNIIMVKDNNLRKQFLVFVTSVISYPSPFNLSFRRESHSPQDEQRLVSRIKSLLS